MIQWYIIVMHFNTRIQGDKNAKKGYTLIELVLVMMLLSLLLAMVVPKLHTAHDYYLDALAKELLYDIRFVKVMNMTEPTKSYSILLREDGYMIKYADPMPKVYKRLETKPGYCLYYYDHHVQFNANGSPIRAQTINIHNVHTSKHRKITINVNTGRILLYD